MPLCAVHLYLSAIIFVIYGTRTLGTQIAGNKALRCCMHKIQLSENSRGLWPFLGSVQGFPRKIRENSGKLQENISRIAKCFNFLALGTGKGKPAANLGSTLPGTLSPPYVQSVVCNRQLQPSQVFLKLQVQTADSSFSILRKKVAFEPSLASIVDKQNGSPNVKQRM